MKPSTRTNAMREVLTLLAQDCETYITYASFQGTFERTTSAHRAAFKSLAAEFRARAAGHKGVRKRPSSSTESLDPERK